MDLRLLRILASALVPTLVGLVVLAAALASDDAPGWVGSVIVALVGTVSIAALGWIRQLPVRPGDEAAYGKAATIKLAVAEASGIIGFAIALALGPWWVAAVGAAFSLAGLAVAWPSEADRERHELLFLV